MVNKLTEKIIKELGIKIAEVVDECLDENPELSSVLVFSLAEETDTSFNYYTCSNVAAGADFKAKKMNLPVHLCAVVKSANNLFERDCQRNEN